MKAIGVDLGGHKVVAGLVEGRVIKNKIEESTDPTREPKFVIAQIARMAAALGADNQIPVGICIPGAIDAERECAMMVPNFVGWNGLPIRQMFEEGIGACVAIENDANAYALGEGLAGAASGMSDYIVITLGTGIGGGIVSGGRLLIGAHGMAGEIGHIVLGRDELCGSGCQGFGHFEAMCGADALEKKATIIGLGSEPVLKELWRRRDEPAVASLWDFAIDNIARGVASLAHIFDPKLIVIGGGLRKGEGFMELLKNHIPRYLGEPFKRTLKILPSELDTDAPIFGAAASVLSRLG